MRNSVGVLGENAQCHSVSKAGISSGFRWKAAAFILSGFAIGLVTSAAPAQAAPQTPDPAFAALRDYVQSIKADEPAQVVADGSGAAGFKVAEATNLMDYLSGLGSGGNGNGGAAPLAAPAAPKAVSKGVQPKAPEVAASYVGSKVCAGCHTSHIEAFKETLMGKLFLQGKLQCETCHGPGSAHAKAGGGRGVGGIISFRKDDVAREPKENNAICLGCHEKGDRTYWNGSTHEMRDLACTNCHTIMKRVSVKFQLRTVLEPDTCFQCHKDRRAQMARSSHMPLREGKVVCTDCHNPHGSQTEALLRADSINDTCYKCHAEKRGPFLFEHLPVRENCLNCHDPHGSINEYLLKVSRPRLCAECHSLGHSGWGNGINAVQAMSRSCNNCHTMVHGTNSPSGALLQR